jgi:Polyphosphate kinase 2 (PPK2)
MFIATDTGFAPWYVVRSDDKKRAQLNLIRHKKQQGPALLVRVIAEPLAFTSNLLIERCWQAAAGGAYNVGIHKRRATIYEATPG